MSQQNNAVILSCVSLVDAQMKKVGYNAKGLRICLDRAIPKDEEIQGREDQMVTREELRTKVFFSFIHVLLFSTSLLAARDTF